MGRRAAPRALKSLNAESVAFAGIVAALLSVAFSFLAAPGISAWDMPGHLLMARQFRDSVWPWFSGWSPYGFGGFPQGYFYPPLFEWLTGALGKILPLTLAFKGLLVTTLLALPFALRLFLRGLGYSRTAVSCSLALLFSGFLLFDFPLSMGGMMTATFRAGLVSAQLSLLLFFLYLWALRKASSAMFYAVVAGVFLGLLALCHAFGTLFAAASSAAYLLLYFTRDRGAQKRYLLHLLIAAAIGLGWVGPFLKFKMYSTGIAIPKESLHQAFPEFPGFLWLILALALARIVLHFARDKNRSCPPVFALWGISTAVVLFGYACGGWIQRTPQVPPIHFYRFGVFALAFASILAGELLSRLPARRSLFVALLILLGYSASVAQRQVFHPRIEQADLSALSFLKDRRGLVDLRAKGTIARAWDSPQAFVYQLQDAGFDVVNGTFVESSATAPFIYAFLKALSPDAFVWPMAHAPLERRHLVAEIRTLGIQWILRDRPFSEEEEFLLKPKLESTHPLRVEVGGEWRDEPGYVYEFEQPKISLLAAAPIPIDRPGSWKDFTYSEWSSHPDSFAVRARPGDALPPFAAREPSDEVNLTAAGEGHYRLSVKASGPRWLVARLPYFPDWHAFSQDREIPIYQSSTNFMILNAKGDVELVYARGWFEKVCAVATFTSLGLIFASFLAYRAWPRGDRQPSGRSKRAPKIGDSVRLV